MKNRKNIILRTLCSPLWFSKISKLWLFGNCRKKKYWMAVYDLFCDVPFVQWHRNLLTANVSLVVKQGSGLVRHIRNVSVSDFNWDISYFEWLFNCFPQSLLCKCRDRTSNKSRPPPSKSFPIYRLPAFQTVANLLTPWSRVLLVKLTGSQLVKQFPAFYGTRRFITAFTSAHHIFLSWARSIQSTPPHPTSWRSILKLSLISTWVFQVVSFPRVSPPEAATLKKQ
jgi:hypothetical protein